MPSARRAQVGEARLALARDRLGLEAESPLELALELGAVGGVAHGAGEHRDHTLRAGCVNRLPVLRARFEHALHGGLAEASGRVHAFTQTRDDRAPVQLAHPAVLHLGDQQPRGVRPDVDDGDLHRRAVCRMR